MELMFAGKQVKNDLALEGDGVWAEVDVSAQELVDIYDECPDELEDGYLYLRVARFGNAKAQKRATALGKKFNLKKPTQQKNYLIELMSETILLDWAGVTDAKGVEIKYTPEVGKEVMRDDEYEWLRDIVSGVSRDAQNYRAENISSVGKN